MRVDKNNRAINKMKIKMKRRPKSNASVVHTLHTKHERAQKSNAT